MGKLTNFPNGVSSFGIPLLGNGIYPMFTGTSYFVDPTNGLDGNDGLTPTTARKTILSAYNSTVANNNDVVYLIGNASWHTLSAALVWSKSYTHMVGLGSCTYSGQRSRVQCDSDFDLMITISGSGCIFANMKWVYGRGGADNHTMVYLSGNYNYFENMHFAAMNHLTEAADASSIGVDVRGSENTFETCNFGDESIVRSGANSMVQITTGGRDKFNNCIFQLYSTGDTDPVHVKVVNGASDYQFIWFNSCIFHNYSAAVTQAVNVDRGDVLFTGNCVQKGSTALCDTTGKALSWITPATATTGIGTAINVV